MNQKIANTIERSLQIIALAVCLAVAALMLTGCAATGKAVTQSASGKNLNLDGYVMLGELETANAETATPTGKMIMGRVTYKSRRVGIPADQKVPTAGYFKSTKTKSLFGTEEQIIEYDFTAGSEADAKAALEELEKRRQAAEKADGNKTPTAGNADAALDNSKATEVKKTK